MVSASSAGASAPATTRLPVTVVTGFLGSGKTTLVRELLLHGQQRLAVLVNEFGEVGIDGDLLRSCGFCPEEEMEGRLVELANGCLCCTVQDDFLPTMELLLERADQLDGILVETSGLALPEPLVAAFGWPEIRTRTRVNGLVTVVDGEALAAGAVVADPASLEAQRQADPSLDHATAIEELFAEQLEAADLVLVSRGETLDAAALERVRERVRPLVRAGTAILPMERGRIDPAVVLGLTNRPPDSEESGEEGAGGDHDHDHTHVAMQALALRRQGTYSRVQVEAALRKLTLEHGLIRLKGRLWQAGKARPLVLQAVGPRFESWFEAGPGHGADRGPSLSAPEDLGLELVLLGFGLEQQGMEQALNQALEHALAGA